MGDMDPECSCETWARAYPEHHPNCSKNPLLADLSCGHPARCARSDGECRWCIEVAQEYRNGWHHSEDYHDTSIAPAEDITWCWKAHKAPVRDPETDAMMEFLKGGDPP